MTNFELATRIPLMIRAPWLRSSVGKRTGALVEAVDLYATLADLAGLPPPTIHGQDINGTSLAPLFSDPTHAIVKDASFSQFAKVSTLSVDAKFWRNQTALMGYSVRTTEWRYTAWFNFSKTKLVPNTDEILGSELYSHIGDTGLYLDFAGENVNLVHNPEYAELVSTLHKQVLDYIRLYPVATPTI